METQVAASRITSSPPLNDLDLHEKITPGSLHCQEAPGAMGLEDGAGEGDRTLDPQFTKLQLYH